MGFLLRSPSYGGQVDGGGLRTVRPTSAGHARARREVGRLVLQPPSSIAPCRLPEIRFGKRYNVPAGCKAGSSHKESAKPRARASRLLCLCGQSRACRTMPSRSCGNKPFRAQRDRAGLLLHLRHLWAQRSASPHRRRPAIESLRRHHILPHRRGLRSPRLRQVPIGLRHPHMGAAQNKQRQHRHRSDGGRPVRQLRFGRLSFPNLIPHLAAVNPCRGLDRNRPLQHRNRLAGIHAEATAVTSPTPA